MGERSRFVAFYNRTKKLFHEHVGIERCVTLAGSTRTRSMKHFIKIYFTDRLSERIAGIAGNVQENGFARYELHSWHVG